MSSDDRRAPGTTRMPFEGLVEVGGALGPGFEAQAVNVSEDGMLLRTAYLPEAGQPLTCRFDAGSNASVLASGEVVWTQGAEKGGEFAIRFTDMDPESVDALKKLCGVGVPAPAPITNGSKVRLHIEGLASPMRAKIKDACPSEIKVGSDLGFLQVGKPLELEDATSGNKRPACIDRVEVEIDPNSHVPQLVVTLRYADGDAADAPAPAVAAPAREKADDLAAVEEASAQMKGAVARHIARIGPAVERLASRAKTTVALLAARGMKRESEPGAARRTTSPPPGGGLHAEGKRVVRGEPSLSGEEAPPAPRFKLTRRNAAIGGGVMAVAILGALALKGHHHDGPTEVAAAEGAAAAASAATATAAADPLTAANAAQGGAVSPSPFGATPSPFPPATSAPPAPAAADPLAEADDTNDMGATPEHKKHVHVTPFGNGPVHHGNILRLKMDGPIESIEGAQQPTGFAVKIPGHKSLEAAAPLAARDSRIAAIKVANDGAGAELTVAFKDGVPNYQVSAHGDSLVIALAPAGDLSKVASKDEKGSKSPKHHKAAHKKD